MWSGLKGHQKDIHHFVGSPTKETPILCCILLGCWDCNCFLPANGFSDFQPLKVSHFSQGGGADFAAEHLSASEPGSEKLTRQEVGRFADGSPVRLSSFNYFQPLAAEVNGKEVVLFLVVLFLVVSTQGLLTHVVNFCFFRSVG